MGVRDWARRKVAEQKEAAIHQATLKRLGSEERAAAYDRGYLEGAKRAGRAAGRKKAQEDARYGPGFMGKLAKASDTLADVQKKGSSYGQGLEAGWGVGGGTKLSVPTFDLSLGSQGSKSKKGKKEGIDDWLV